MSQWKLTGEIPNLSSDDVQSLKKYQNLVQDKEDQLMSSQSRIDRLEEEIDELTEKLRQANVVISEKAWVEQELVKVQQENAELRASLQESRRNDEYRAKLQELMNEKVPSLEKLIELTLQQEREKNERKNEKVLEILSIKDSLIEDLEEKCAEMQEVLTQMQHKQNDTRVLLSNTEKSLQIAQKAIEDLKTANFEKDQMIFTLNTKNGGLETEIKNLAKMLAESQNSSKTFKKEDLLDSRRITELSEENLKLSTSLKEISDRTTTLEAAVSQKNREIINLQNEIITYRKNASESVKKNVHENEIAKLATSVKEEQLKFSKLKDENTKLKSNIKTLETNMRSLEVSNKQMNNDLATMADQSEKINQKNKEIKDLRKENDKLRQDIKTMIEKNEVCSADTKNIQNTLNQHKGKVTKLKATKNKQKKDIESLCKEIKELNSVKEAALMKVEKVYAEMKMWQSSQIELLADREKKIADLQTALKELAEEKLQLAQNLADQEKKKSEDLKQNYLKELQGLNETIDILQKENFQLKCSYEDERFKLVNQIAELEENISYGNKAGEYSGMGVTIKKDPDIQLASLQNLIREKIVVLDEETRRRIDAENKLRSVLMSESLAEKKIEEIQESFVEKIHILEAELQENEQNMKLSLEEREELMKRYEHVTNLLKETTENLKRVEKDMLSMQQEHNSKAFKYAAKLQNSETSSVELKSKIKEFADNNERLLRENEGLYDHLKSVEKEQELISLKLEDMEKVNSSLKAKLKDYEHKILEADDLRVLENSEYSSNLDSLKAELKATYKEFEKTIEQFDGQIASLKEQYYSELKQKKNPKKALESVEFALQLAKKDGIIRSLKNELKSVKPKKLDKKPRKLESPQKEAESILLQNQVYKLKAQVKSLESQLCLSREEAEKISQEVESKPLNDSNPRKEIIEMERRHRNDMQKLAEEVTRLREKWHSPEEWTQLQSVNRDLELSIKRLNDELARKKEMLDSLKAQKDQNEYERDAIQEELEQIKDSSEKIKKLKLDISRKDRAISEMKSFAEALKESEKRVTDENNSLYEKIKGFKNDIARKDAVIKDLKNKLETSGLESARIVGEECEKLKDKIKKLKLDCERKENQIKSYKAKLETTELELETVQTEKQNLSTDVFAALEKEVKKNERLQNLMKKTETQFQSLCSITRRIFKELTDSVELLRSKAGNNIEKEYYSDCMDILNMDMNDLSEFVGHKSVGTVLCRIERLLDQGEFNSEILEIFNQLLEERVQLEKSTQKSSGRRNKKTLSTKSSPRISS